MDQQSCGKRIDTQKVVTMFYGGDSIKCKSIQNLRRRPKIKNLVRVLQN